MQQELQKLVDGFKTNARKDDATRQRFIADFSARCREMRKTNSRDFDQLISLVLGAIKLMTSEKEGSPGTDIPATLVALEVLLATRCMTPLQLSLCNNHVQFCLRSCDATSAKAACAAFGRCIQQSPPSDVVRQQTNDALLWLADTTAMRTLRRTIGVLMLQDIATYVPVMLVPKLPEFFENIWSAVTDSNIEIRDKACDLFRTVVAILQSRPQQTQATIFTSLINKVRQCIGSKNTEVMIGALLVFEPIFLCSAGVLPSQYSQGWAMIWPLKEHVNPIVRLYVVNAVKILVKYDPAMFTALNLGAVMDYALEAVRKETERSSIFQLLSDVIRHVPPADLKRFEDHTIHAIKMCFSQTKRAEKPPVWEALECLATICCVSPANVGLEAHIVSCIEPVFSWGLTPQLIAYLKDVIQSCTVKTQTRLQERLLDVISVTLCGLQFRQRKEQTPLVISTANADHTGQILVALEALVKFDFSNLELMGDFLRDSVVPFLDDPSVDIRKAAIATVSKLLFPSGPMSVARGMVVDQVIAKLLVVFSADTEHAVRSAVLKNISRKFYPHLAQNHYLQYLVLGAGDEARNVRMQADTLLCKLLEYNPSQILPVLRKVLISVLSGCNDAIRENLTTLNVFAEHAPSLVATFTGNIMKLVSPLIDKVSRREEHTPILLELIGRTAMASGNLISQQSVEHMVQKILDLLASLGYDKEVVPLRLDCLRTVGNVLQYTGQVQEPYSTFPSLLKVLTSTLRSPDETVDVRVEALRVLGIVGATDPHRLSALKEAGDTPHAQGGVSHYDNASVVKALLKELAKLIDPANGVANSEPLIRSAISTLITIIDSCPSCLQDIHVCIPSIIAVLDTMPESKLRSTIIVQLTRVIDAAGSTAGSHLPVLTAFILRNWGSEAQLMIISLCTSLTLAVWEDSSFPSHLTQLIPKLNEVLDSPYTADREPLLCAVLNWILVAGSLLAPFAELVVRSLMVLLPSLDTNSTRIYVMKTLAEWSQSVNLRVEAGAIIRVVVKELDLFYQQTVPAPPKNHPYSLSCVEVLVALMEQLQGDYVKFASIAHRVLEAHRVSTQQYSLFLSELMAGRTITSSSSVSETEVRRFRAQLESISQREIEIQVEVFATREDSSVYSSFTSEKRTMAMAEENLPIEEKVVTQRANLTDTFLREASKADWIEWYSRLTLDVLQQSPLKVYRCVSTHFPPPSLAERAPSFVGAIFSLAFRVFWLTCSSHTKNVFVTLFTQLLLTAEVPDEVMLPLLDLAEFLDCTGIPLPIPTQKFASVAEDRGVLAKALRWKESDFSSNPQEASRDLIALYSKLNHAESAVGVLTVAGKEDPEGSLMQGSLIKLGRYAEALEQMQRDVLRTSENWSVCGCDVGSFSRDGRPNSPKPRRRTLSTVSDEGVQETTTVVEKSLPQGDELILKKVLCLSETGDVEEVLVQWKAQLARQQEENALKASTEPLGRMSPSPRKSSSADGQGSENGEEEENLLAHLAPYAAEAAIRLGAWDTVERAAPIIPAGTLESFLTAASLHIHRSDWTQALQSVLNARRLLLDDVSNFLSESYTRAYDSIVVAQQLAELEEIISVFSLSETDRRKTRKSVVYSIWDRRMEKLASGVRHWKRILSSRRLLRLPNEDIATRINFVELCREQRHVRMEKFTLGELIGSPNPSKQYLLDPSIDAMVVLEYIKYLSNSGLLYRGGLYGDEQSLLSEFIARLAAVEGNTSLLARFYVRMASNTIGNEAVELLEKATCYDPGWFRGWHFWANANMNLLANSATRTQAAAIAAVTGYFKSISLGPRVSIFQDALRLLSVWSQFARCDEFLEVLEEQLDRVSIDTWLLVIPQLVARLDYGSDRSCDIVRNLLTKVGIENPTIVLYPLAVCTAGEGRRYAAATTILQALRKEHPRIVSESTMIATELTRVADSLPQNSWWLALEAAAKAFFWRKDGDEMVSIMMPLHEKLEQMEPATIMEIEFKQRFGRTLLEAKGWLTAYQETRSPGCLDTCWSLYQSIHSSLNVWRDRTSSLALQYCSPKLFEARNLAVNVLSTNIKAVAFLPTLRVMKSKQRPCRFKLLGSDGVEYAFLLKGGEDLRLDERVMQLFKLVNTVLAASTNTREISGYQIHRYSVTPVWTSVGVLGWVEGCGTLEEVITEHRKNRKVPAQLEFDLLPNVLPVLANNTMDTCHEHLSVIQKVEVLEYLLDHSSGHDIRKAMWISSGDSETWLQKRTAYTRSLATMSMTGYILGLGDRHPQNIMIQHSTGKVVHIDFGDCFEVAMKREKCPEKVPFRLTRMLCNAMEVAGVEGHFRSAAEAVMMTIRESRGSVLAMLEAFLYDPLISMRLTERAQKEDAKEKGQQLEHDPTLVESADLTSPQDLGVTVQFENTALLEPGASGGVPNSMNSNQEVCGNPAVKEGTISEEAVEIMRRLESKLRGKDFKSKRRTELGAKAQVDRLIEEATSTTNLAQAYLGWHPFW